MHSADAESESRDILSDHLTAAIVYWLPILALVISGALKLSVSWHTTIWVAALSTMGIGCVVNAARCGRVHCYFTGPFFLILAVVVLLNGLGKVPLGVYGWSVLSIALVLGGLLLYYVPELIVGKYRRQTR